MQRTVQLPSLTVWRSLSLQVLNAHEKAHAVHFQKLREQFAPHRLDNNPHRMVKTTSQC